MFDQLMYVGFNKDNGDIISIGNEVPEEVSYVTVPVSNVLTVLNGLEPMRNYVVQFNPKTKSLEFVSRFEYVHDIYSVNELIYQIPEQMIEDPDVLLIQDIPNTCWKIQIGKEFKKNLKSKGASLNANIMFSITEKNDPNILYKTLFVDFAKAVNDNYYIIPFSMPFETVDTPISVYTSKRFDTYQFKRIYE